MAIRGGGPTNGVICLIVEESRTLLLLFVGPELKPRSSLYRSTQTQHRLLLHPNSDLGPPMNSDSAPLLYPPSFLTELKSRSRSPFSGHHGNSWRRPNEWRHLLDRRRIQDSIAPLRWGSHRR
ncbi:hypothetical protein TIFTF001_024850 [Ficus carica]|uniref:Uncharacterized protein n=1 Tax=Ficus carica TaxID=3494 RepID=A0AA88DGA7_FICCA|nr:hypothetical protein TIFTF001_024850 [Ficus carica]